MNWYIHDKNKMITDAWDHCDHLEVGQIAPYVLGEEDSFGPVARNGMCKECYDECKKAAGEEIEICYDCGQEKPKKETQEWRWYDFHAPQGDEPMIICDECAKKEKHIKRVRKDHDDLRAELGDADDYYDDFYYDDEEQ